MAEKIPVVVIIDLDGTIVESKPADVLFCQGFKLEPGKQIIGEYAVSAILHLLKGGIGRVSEHLIETVQTIWHGGSYSNGSYPLVSGMEEALEASKSLVLYLALISSNRREFVERTGRKVLPLFDYVVTRENAGRKSDGLQLIIDKFGLPKHKHCLFGDTIWDERAAGKAGIHFRGVGWGWKHFKPVNDYGFARTPSEIPQIIQQTFL